MTNPFLNFGNSNKKSGTQAIFIACLEKKESVIFMLINTWKRMIYE